MKYEVKASITISMTFEFDTDDYADDFGGDDDLINPTDHSAVMDYVHDNLLKDDGELDGLMSANGYDIDQAEIISAAPKES
jgi:hypothetical protein